MIEPPEVTVSYSSLDTRFNPQSDLKDTSNQDIEAAAQAEKKDPQFHEIAQKVEAIKSYLFHEYFTPKGFDKRMVLS